MQVFLILCLILAVCASHTEPPEICGVGLIPERHSRRTFGTWYKTNRNSKPLVREGRVGIGRGKRAGEAQFPWIVSLRKSGFICGGSIINNRTILTAAHCVFGAKLSDIELRINSLKLYEGSIFKVSEIKIYTSYNKDNFDYDIALLITADKIPIDDKDIKPVQLAKHEPVSGANATVAGWGRDEKNEGPSLCLKYAFVEIIDRETCQTKYGNNYITDRMICADAGKGGMNSCEGDSGGPLTQNNVQVGVVSNGPGCTNSVTPVLYSNVAKLLSWINSNKA